MLPKNESVVVFLSYLRGDVCSESRPHGCKKKDYRREKELQVVNEIPF